MSEKIYELTITSTSSYRLFLKAPENATKEELVKHWQKYDGDIFECMGEGGWDFHSLEESEYDPEDINTGKLCGSFIAVEKAITE